MLLIGPVSFSFYIPVSPARRAHETALNEERRVIFQRANTFRGEMGFSWLMSRSGEKKNSVLFECLTALRHGSVQCPLQRNRDACIVYARSMSTGCVWWLSIRML
jgi:hypothetical protein